jgi:hypothetical protein
MERDGHMQLLGQPLELLRAISWAVLDGKQCRL